MPQVLTPPYAPCGLPIHDGLLDDWQSHEIGVAIGTRKNGSHWIQQICSCGVESKKVTVLKVDGTKPITLDRNLRECILEMAEHVVLDIPHLASITPAA